MIINNVFIRIAIVVSVICSVSQNQVYANTIMNIQLKQSPKTNYLAPSFELPGFDGKTYRVGGERNKLLLINFWASWCEPCHLEARDLENIYNEYKDQLDLYAVNATFVDSQADAVDFVSEYELTFPTLIDESGAVTRGKYWIDGYPTSYLVSQAGVIEEIYYGVVDKLVLERDIKKQLAGNK